MSSNSWVGGADYPDASGYKWRATWPLVRLSLDDQGGRLHLSARRPRRAPMRWITLIPPARPKPSKLRERHLRPHAIGRVVPMEKVQCKGDNPKAPARTKKDSTALGDPQRQAAESGDGGIRTRNPVTLDPPAHAGRVGGEGELYPLSYVPQKRGRVVADGVLPHRPRSETVR